MVIKNIKFNSNRFVICKLYFVVSHEDVTHTSWFCRWRYFLIIPTIYGWIDSCFKALSQKRSFTLENHIFVYLTLNYYYDMLLTTATSFSELVTWEPVVESTALERKAVDRLARNKITTTEFIIMSETE